MKKITFRAKFVYILIQWRIRRRYYRFLKLYIKHGYSNPSDSAMYAASICYKECPIGTRWLAKRLNE